MPEAAGDQVTHPVHVAGQQRLVEAELDRQLVNLLGSGVDAELLLGRVTRKVIDHHEGEKRHSPQHRNRHQQAATQEPKHGR